MSDTKKKRLNSSLDKSSSGFTSNLIYILTWLLLVGVLSLGMFLGLKWWENRQAKKQFEERKVHIFDVKDIKPPQEKDGKVSTNYDLIRRTIIKNHRIAKKLDRKIGRNSKEYDQWRPVLEKIESKLKELKELKELKDNEEEMEALSVAVSQQGESLRRLGNQVIPAEETRAQEAAQRKWLEEIFPQEKEEAIQKINEFLFPFYDQFYQSLPEAEKTPGWNIRPFSDSECEVPEKLDPPQLKDKIESLLRKFPDNKPKKANWLGFTDLFDQDKHKKNDESNYYLSGITIDTPKVKEGLRNSRPPYFWISISDRKLSIEMKREVLFSRQSEDYDEWISELNNTENGITWKPWDISEESMINTLAHELAHAIINANFYEYEEWNGGSGGGHGSLHDRYTEEIEEMMKNSPSYKKFIEWWREPRKNKNG